MERTCTMAIELFDLLNVPRELTLEFWQYLPDLNMPSTDFRLQPRVITNNRVRCVLAAQRVAHHRPSAVIDLRFSRRGHDHGAGFWGLGSAQLANE